VNDGFGHFGAGTDQNLTGSRHRLIGQLSREHAALRAVKQGVIARRNFR
jgi:hypothetical protein